MKKTALFSSLLTILLCFSLIAGSSFALFTSESKVSIAVTSGNVEMIAAVEEIQTWSLEDDKALAGRTDGSFTQGGSAIFDPETATLSLAKIVPGDKVSFHIVGNNASDVTVQYRYKIACIEGLELMSGLSLTINGKEYSSLSVYASAWKTLAAESDMEEIAVSIELPATAGNEFQGLTSTLAVTVEAIQGNASVTGEEEIVFFDLWDGGADVTWYDEASTEFILKSAEQFAGFYALVDEGTTFEGKTIQLEADLDLTAYDENGERVSFEPIGSYKNDTPFKGTFDGQGHTVSNLYQSGWALGNDYYSADLGLGLFGLVEDATIKNLNIDGAEMTTETNLVGAVAGAAYGDCRFENITVSNTKMGNYQYYSGGIVGWASGNHEYINCDVDASVVIASQWGDFDNSNGGVIGGVGGNATILLKDCDVACVMDVYNDVTSSYQWYAYRRAGMLIGNTSKTVNVEGTTYAAAPQLTCENCTVTYGAWANYTYCEFAGQSWPYVRVQAGYSADGYSNPRYGVATDANGNKVVDDTHVHNDGEDHNILCAFDQLYGGGQGVYGAPTHDGVTVIYNNK